MISLDRLLKLRLVVARHGEMDRAGWWNTNGMLGRHGAIALAARASEDAPFRPGSCRLQRRDGRDARSSSTLPAR